ncbi:MAG TPA: hypothetical protein VMI55_06800 [Thermoplasmata archaeon]|nr:hypothetical protein [Thermoplasmata archaeon]
MPDAPVTDRSWGACRYCAVAVPPGATKCPECGAPDPITSRELPKLRGRVRRRIQTLNFFRTLIVIGVAGGLAYTMISLAISGPPTVPDPLTTAGTWTIGAGNFTVISGEITGGDYVQGNFTTTDPAGTNLGVAVYNSTQWVQFVEGQDPAPQWSTGPSDQGLIVFAAPYTDTFTFVFTNPYPPVTHLTIEAYIVTTYESNVGDDGFG